VALPIPAVLAPLSADTRSTQPPGTPGRRRG
jgi:hypothetical protein